MRHAIKLLRDEIDRDMALIGITTLAEMRRERLTAARGAEFLAADERQWTPTRSKRSMESDQWGQTLKAINGVKLKAINGVRLD